MPGIGDGEAADAVADHPLYNRHLTAELVRLMGLMRAAGIAAVAFKGPVLAAMAYGSIDLRQFVDLDILVHQTDLPRVAEILAAERYLSPHTRREGLATNYFQESEDAFFSAGGIGAVDVHWKLTPRSFRFAPTEESFWRRARAVELEVGTVTAIAPEDLLLYMCVHAAKHGWIQLGSICNVAETLRARPAIDLMAILDEATTLGSRRMFLTGIYLAHELVGAPVPEDLVAIAAQRPQRARIGNARREPALQRSRSRRHALRSMGGADSLDRRHPPANPLRRPADAGADDGRLRTDAAARPLFPLYWLIRPFRMALQYGPRLLRKP